MFWLYRRESDQNQTWYLLIGLHDSFQQAEAFAVEYPLSEFRVEESLGWGSSIIFETPIPEKSVDEPESWTEIT